MIFYCNQIIKRAFDLAGATDSYSDDINANEFNPVFTKLQDLLASMNNDPQIIFGYNTLENIDCKGYNTVYFKPLTDEEIETSATNFDANRLFYEIPSTPPAIICNGRNLDQIIHSQLILLRSQCSSGPALFSFSREYDRATIAFNAAPNALVTFVYPKSIDIPSEPTSELKVPQQFINFIVASLALEICALYNMTESIAIVSDKMKSERDKIINNNQLNRQDVYMDLNLDRFEYGYSNRNIWRS